jgi:Cys-rich repeat protein
MSLVFRLSCTALLLVLLSSPVWAQTPGDVGTAKCREVQLAAQNAVNNVLVPPKNHGQLMKVVTRVTSPEKEAGNITAACESCIVSQFARQIPIADQKPCGPDLPPPRPECAPATCSTFIPCEQGAPATCSVPVCISTPEGQGFCVDGTTSCDQQGCTASSDCPSGEVCAINTCCGTGVCIPPEAFCPAPAPA